MRQLTLQMCVSPHMKAGAASPSIAPAASAFPPCAEPFATTANAATSDVAPTLTKRRLNLSTPPKSAREAHATTAKPTVLTSVLPRGFFNTDHFESGVSNARISYTTRGTDIVNGSKPSAAFVACQSVDAAAAACTCLLRQTILENDSEESGSDSNRQGPCRKDDGKCMSSDSEDDAFQDAIGSPMSHPAGLRCAHQGSGTRRAATGKLGSGGGGGGGVDDRKLTSLESHEPVSTASRNQRRNIADVDYEGRDSGGNPATARPIRAAAVLAKERMKMRGRVCIQRIHPHLNLQSVGSSVTVDGLGGSKRLSESSGCCAAQTQSHSHQHGDGTGAMYQVSEQQEQQEEVAMGVSLPEWSPRRPGYADLATAVLYRRAHRLGLVGGPAANTLPRCWGVGLLGRWRRVYHCHCCHSRCR